MIIKKKILPKYFKLFQNNKKHFELRLADFKIKRGDTLILREWNPKKKEYTGKELKFKTGLVVKIPFKDLYKFKLYSINAIKKHGIYVIELTK